MWGELRDISRFWKITLITISEFPSENGIFGLKISNGKFLGIQPNCGSSEIQTNLNLSRVFDKFLFIIRWTVSSSFCPCFYHKTEMTKEKSICQKNNQDQYFCNFIMGWPRDNWSWLFLMDHVIADRQWSPGDFKSSSTTDIQWW